MKFTPRTEAETKQESANLWEPGFYDFEIMTGTDKTSKSGNEMIELKVKIFNNEGEEKIVFDYLLESMAWKLRHASEACGLLAKYEKGELVGGDFEGCTGKLKLKIDRNKDQSYPDKNAVTDYVSAPAKERAVERKTKKSPAADLNDELPPDWA